MRIRNITVLVKPEETLSDLMQEVAVDNDLTLDEPFAFSAIKGKDNKIKINCIEPAEHNPYSIRTLFNLLFHKKSDYDAPIITYAQPPLEQWLDAYKPMLYNMVNRAHPYYSKLISNRDDMLSSLYFVVVKLYNKGYYLHQHLIYKAFINQLNMEVRQLKLHQNNMSLEEPLGHDEEGKAITLLDTLCDQQSTDEAYNLSHYSMNDYLEDLFNQLKETMLEDMSQLSFDRILLQLKSKTVTTQTSRILSKYRDIFNPSYIPRPNARKNKQSNMEVTVRKPIIVINKKQEDTNNDK